MSTDVHREELAMAFLVIGPMTGGICGVTELVAHVSMTSGSPMKPFGFPVACHLVEAGRRLGEQIPLRKLAQVR